jgi:DNA polymerase III alpha subunit
VLSIINERKENGKFKDLSDFAGRVSHRAFNKKSLGALIKAGALDCFGDRKKLIESLDRILVYNKSKQRERLLNQQSLFSVVPSVMSDGITLRDVEPATMNEILGWEKEILGIYVSGHPYDEMHKIFSKYLVDCEKVATCQDGKYVKCGGVITSVKEILTKKGDPMAFVGLEDVSGQTEIIVFPKSYETLREYLIEDSVILVSARVSRRDDEEGKLIANTFITIANGSELEVQEMLSQGMWVPGYTKSEDSETCVNDSIVDDTSLSMGSLSITLKGKPTPEMVGDLREIFKGSPGSKAVCLVVESGGHMRKIETEYLVSASDEMINDVASIVGRQNVSVS